MEALIFEYYVAMRVAKGGELGGPPNLLPILNNVAQMDYSVR